MLAEELWISAAVDNVSSIRLAWGSSQSSGLGPGSLEERLPSIVSIELGQGSLGSPGKPPPGHRGSGFPGIIASRVGN